MRYLLWFLLFTGSVWCACWRSDASTPEEVAVLWQSSLDQNRFDEARALSAHQARAYVDALDSVTTADQAPNEPTELLQLRCMVNGDRAVCSYLIEDESGEKNPDTMILLRVKGRWTVDKVGGFVQIINDTIQPGEGPVPFSTDSTDRELE